jgi:negative regulator of sigma F NrsF-like protein
MECRDVHDAIRRGELAAEHDAHLATCAPCHSLAAGGSLVGRALARSEREAGELGALFATIDARGGGRLDRLRARTRIGAALAVAALVPAAVFVLAPRADLPSYPAGRMVLAIALLAAALLGLAARALRPLDRADRAPWVDAPLVAGAVVVTFLLALLPPAHAEAAVNVWRSAVKCLGFGAVAGAPVAAVLLALDRVRSRRAIAEAALAAAVAANLALQLHCPIVDGAHIALGHALLAPLAGALALVWVARGRRPA